MPQRIEVPGMGIVEFPDGMSDDQIAAAIKQNMPKSEGPSSFKMGLADPIHGGAQLLTQVLPDKVVKFGDQINNWLAEKTGMVAKLPPGGVDQQVREREQAYQSQRAAAGEDGIDWARLGGNMLSPVNIGIGAVAPGAATLAGRMAAGAGAGAAASALNPVTADGGFAGEKAKQIGIGAVGGAAVPAVAAGLGRVISPAASTNPQVQALRAEGVRPTIGQTMGGVANKVEERAMSLPIVGDSIAAARTRAAEQLNTAVANRALAPLGERAPTNVQGRDLVAAVQTRLSDAYNQLLPRLTVRADQQFQQELRNLNSMVQTGSIDPNAARAFTRVLQNDLVGKFRGQNALTGQTLKQVESDLTEQISRFRASTDADQRLVGDALDTVRDSLRNLVQRTNPQYARELSAINQGWANFKRLERAASYVGAEDGVFNASQLQSAVKALDRSKDKGRFSRGQAMMQDLSDPAKAVLGSKVPNSGTADRLLNFGAMGSALVDPMIPGSLLGGSLLYSRPAQNLLTGALARRPAAAQPVAGLLNRTAPVLGPGGGLLALDVLE